MHNTATRSSSPRLLRLSQQMLQLNLSALHHLPQCLLPLHPLMLRNDVSIRGSELLSSARDLNGSALRALCVKRIPKTTTTTTTSAGVARVASARVAAHVRVVTASDVHLSRKHTIEVLEQVLLSVRQDVANRPSPTDDTVSLCLHPVTVSLRRHYCVTKTLCFFKLFPATGAKEVQAAKFDGEARSHTPLSRHPCSVRVRRETQKAAYAYSGGAEQGGFCCRGRPAAVRCVYCMCAVMNSRDVLVSRAMCSY